MVLLVSATDYEPGGFADNRIQVRIDSILNAKHALESEARSGTFPRDLSNISRENGPGAKEGDIVDESVEELAALLEYEPLASPKSKPDEQIQGIEIVEPLDNFDKRPNSKSSPNGPLLINWVNGRERGILSFPVIDAAKFPQKSEKLLDVVIKIRVSPQGEVLSAELVPPGSGDTRIDRYMHSVALQLTLEPLLENGGVQEALLRLLFLEDDL